MQTSGNDQKVRTNGSRRRATLGKRLVGAVTFLVNVGLAAAAVMVGVTTIQMRAEEKPEISASPLTEVRVITPQEEEGYRVARTFAGRLEPARQTDLAFELSGTLMQIRREEGDSVTKGDVIARLDTRALETERRRQQANRLAAESDRELAFLTLSRRQQLQEAGHVSAEVLDQARLALSRLDATLAQIDAAIEAIEINLDKSVLRAPFSGRIGARLLDEGATVSPGLPVLSILESARPLVRIGLPPDLANRLVIGDGFEIRIGSQAYAAEFIGIRPDLQTRTRTIEALFELPENMRPLGFGDLAELTLSDHVAARGYWLPMAALKEGPRGLWTVLALNGVETGKGSEVPADLIVVREAVEVLHADAGKVFVRGTITPRSRILAGGVHRVVVGQAVRLAESGV